MIGLVLLPFRLTFAILKLMWVTLLAVARGIWWVVSGIVMYIVAIVVVVAQAIKDRGASKAGKRNIV